MCERSSNGSLPFLDVDVNQCNSVFQTQVYLKPTNPGQYFNGNSEYHKKYKDSAVNTFIRRAISHCSTWASTHCELERITQCLANNRYTNKHVNSSIKNALNKWYTRPATPPPEENNIKSYYRAFIHSKYKESENNVKKIVLENVTLVEEGKRIQLVMYYRNNKTANLLMKNLPKPTDDPLKQRKYICMTTIHLSRRISCHV